MAPGGGCRGDAAVPRDLGYAGASKPPAPAPSTAPVGPPMESPIMAPAAAPIPTYDGAQFVGMAAMAGDKQCCADQSSQRAGKPTRLH